MPDKVHPAHILSGALPNCRCSHSLTLSTPVGLSQGASHLALGLGRVHGRMLGHSTPTGATLCPP